MAEDPVIDARGRAAATAFPEPLAAAESELLRQRRANADPAPLASAVGMGLSGGGVRSATFALGFFQALARHDRAKQIDYLSTVSGGGYFGGFYGTLFRRDQTASVRDTLLGTQAAPPTLRYLRENGRYLAPGGDDDLWLGAATLFRNWLVVQLLLGSALCSGLLIVASVAQLVLQSYGPSWQTELAALGLDSVLARSSWLQASSPWFVAVAALVVVWITPLTWSYWAIGRTLPRFEIPWLYELASGSWIALPFLLAAGVGHAWIEPPRPWSWSAALLTGLALQALATGFLALSSRPHWAPRFAFLAGSAFIACAAASGLPDGTRLWWQLMAAATLLAWLGLAKRAAPQLRTGVAELDGDTLGRFELSSALKTALLVTTALFVFACLDTAARQLPGALRQHMTQAGGLAATVTALAGLVRRYWPRLMASATAQRVQRLPLPTAWLMNLVGCALMGALVTAADLVALAVSRRNTTPLEAAQACLFALLGCSVLGSSRNLLNASSQLPLYSARLIRAYLGASNPRRNAAPAAAPERASPHAATRVMPGDDLPAQTYWGWSDPSARQRMYARGAPLHLVNVTVNETVDGRSQVQQRDRKGVGLAVGPCGFSLGVKHHVAFAEESPPHTYPERGFKVFRFSDDEPGRASWLTRRETRPLFPFDRLSLGQWLGISGAAFSTGLGANTNLGLSVIAALSNVRLGFWWRPGTSSRIPWLHRLLALFWVQSYLFRELLARFPGTARMLWYLSDGGHFENLGGYELIRRRLPLIVLLDAEADPDSRCDGLVNLIRKARIDFGAEIQFLSDTPLHGPYCADLAALRRAETRTGLSRAHAALARVTYADEPERESWLLYVKPTLLGSEPLDLTRYHELHPDFPHESTTDQFFDEAQWESYRKLGELIGERLLQHDGVLANLLDREYVGS